MASSVIRLFLNCVFQINACTQEEELTYYSRCGFQYWIKKEVQNFKKDYELERMPPSREPVS